MRFERSSRGGAQLTVAGKVFLLVVGLSVLGYAGYQTGLIEKVMPAAKTEQSAVPEQVTMASGQLDFAQPAPSSFRMEGLPSSTPANIPGVPMIRSKIWAWNAQMGWIYANGGPRTTEGSLMAKHGVNLSLEREDMNDKLQADLVAFATELAAGNPQPTKGIHFTAVMGDGAAQFLAAINSTLEKLGKDYVAEIIGSAGYSFGEDKFMGPPAWKLNPRKAKGGVVVGVLRDGDWNIAMHWLAMNGIPNNPDDKTYDPDALNWINAESYTKAAEMYVNRDNLCEERPVVQNGKPVPGKTQRVCIDGVVTWTPGDVTAVKNRGGLVSIWSTKENVFQMPNVIIGIRKWNRDNRPLVNKFLAAVMAGGEQVKYSDEALRKGSEISAALYNEESAEYWYKYFKGITVEDREGNLVELGGSRVNNLADNLDLFGLTGGAKQSKLAAVYTGFGDIVVKQYPRLVPNYPPASEAINSTFLADLAKNATDLTPASVPTYTAGPLKQVFGRADYTITFVTGSAEFTPEAQKTLRALYQSLISSGMNIEIRGHTDNVGAPDANLILSKRRADAVKRWLHEQSASDFPDARTTTQALGQDRPVADNSTAEGRAKNRRVEIVVGSTNS